MAMIKIVIIGVHGHHHYIARALEKRLCDVTGVTDASVLPWLSRYGMTPPVYTNYREMLAQVKPDIAVVNEPFYQNAEISAYCLDNGINVFSEKPLATSQTQLDALRTAWSAAKTHGLHLCGMFGIRDTPHFYTAKQLIDSEAIGEIRLMSAQKSYKLGVRADYYKKRETYGGTIAWVAIHAVDWVHWLSGLDFKSVYASHSSACNHGNGELEMTSACLFNLDGGVIATVTADYLRPSAAPTHDDDRIRVAGTDGVLEIRAGRVILIDKNGEREVECVHPQSDIFSDLIYAIQSQTQAKLDGDESLYITEAALNATKSADNGTAVDFGVAIERRM